MPRHACSLDHIGKPWHDLSLSKTSLSMLINDEVVQSKPREREMNPTQVLIILPSYETQLKA
ncbi:hypothetical protein NC651_037554 [Populus alba x Populus x berolinensis]|nr:hypothetical protein NC651_037554 [Populus alba x Populus x berolinensis]